MHEGERLEVTNTQGPPIFVVVLQKTGYYKTFIFLTVIYVSLEEPGMSFGDQGLNLLI